MAGVQDERWEFDLDFVGSETRDPVRYLEVVSSWRDRDGVVYCLLRKRDGSSGLVHRGWLRRANAAIRLLLARPPQALPPDFLGPSSQPSTSEV